MVGRINGARGILKLKGRACEVWSSFFHLILHLVVVYQAHFYKYTVVRSYPASRGSKHAAMHPLWYS
jgi:hypothetical protein